MQPPNILVIEDEPSLGEFIQALLRNEGYHVDLALDGIAGLERFDQDHHDLVITDVIMPRMEGFEICKRLQGAKRPPAIIAMSGGAQEYLNFIRALGVKHIFEKPFKIPSFLASVKQALQERTLLHESD